MLTIFAIFLGAYVGWLAVVFYDGMTQP